MRKNIWSIVFGFNMLKYRELMGLSYHDIVEIAKDRGSGISLSSVYRIERGLASPSLESMTVISQILNIPLSSMLTIPVSPYAGKEDELEAYLEKCPIGDDYDDLDAGET